MSDLASDATSVHGLTKSGGDTIVPIAGAGAGAQWSDVEMHDATQVHWSRFANKAQWSPWTLLPSLHEQGPSLGGIMFDDIGPNHRQGTAIFEDAFIATAPAGDPAPAAWAQRMRCWTAAHEMGHACNLAHSWQKSLWALTETVAAGAFGMPVVARGDYPPDFYVPSQAALDRARRILATSVPTRAGHARSPSPPYASLASVAPRPSEPAAPGLSRITSSSPSTSHRTRRVGSRSSTTGTPPR